MLDSTPLAYPCQESIDPPWHCVIFIASSCSHSRVFSRPETQWPANTETSTTMKLATKFSYRFWQVLQYPPISSRDTTIQKRQSLSTCRLSFSNISLTNSEILPQRKHAI
jgi:hypothetical protein